MRRRMLASVGGKPLPYDAEVEWIGVEGSLNNENAPYINTGITVNSKSVCEIEWMSTEATHGDYKYCGCPSLGIAEINSHWRLCFGNPFAYTLNVPEYHLNQKYNLKFRSGKLLSGYLEPKIWIDGEIVYRDWLNISVEYPFELFRYYNQKTDRFAQRVYSLKWYESNDDYTVDTLTHDMIPVRFTNESGVSEGAMYDSVSGQLFRNAGTGALISGPDKA